MNRCSPLVFSLIIIGAATAARSQTAAESLGRLAAQAGADVAPLPELPASASAEEVARAVEPALGGFRLLARKVFAPEELALAESPVLFLVSGATPIAWQPGEPVPGLPPSWTGEAIAMLPPPEAFAATDAPLRTSERSVHLGAVLHSRQVYHTFTLRNGGPTPVRILRAETSCSSCTLAAREPETLPPGATGSVRVRVSTHEGYGETRYTVILVTDSEGQEKISLDVAASVVLPLDWTPKRLELSATARRTAEVTFLSPLEEELTLSNADEAGGALQLEKVESAPAPMKGLRAWRATVALRGDNPPALTALTLRTNLGPDRTVSIPVVIDQGAATPGATGISFEPESASFGIVRTGQEKSVTVTLRRSGEPFRIVEATADVPGLSAAATSSEAANVQTLTLTAGPAMKPGVFVGKVTVRIQAEREAVAEVKVRGIVKD